MLKVLFGIDIKYKKSYICYRYKIIQIFWDHEDMHAIFKFILRKEIIMKSRKIIAALIAVALLCSTGIVTACTTKTEEQKEAKETEANNADGYSFYETKSGLSVTVSDV